MARKSRMLAMVGIALAATGVAYWLAGTHVWPLFYFLAEDYQVLGGKREFAGTSYRDEPDWDPLGQQPRLRGSIPRVEGVPAYEALKDPRKRERVIKRVQLALALEGYYEGPANGLLDNETEAAIGKYKHDKVIFGDAPLDPYVFYKLGIRLPSDG